MNEAEAVPVGPQLTKIAYCGAAGAFAFLAAAKLFPGAAYRGFPSFEAAYHAVEAGLCDAAVLPLENSSAGAVEAVLTLLNAGPLRVCHTAWFPIRHCLLANPGVTLADVRCVISHAQALRQCSAFLHTLNAVAREAPSTSEAARSLRRSGSRTEAAIASAETAALLGLDILRRNIQDAADNATLFAVFTRAEADSSQEVDRPW